MQVHVQNTQCSQTTEVNFPYLCFDWSSGMSAAPTSPRANQNIVWEAFLTARLSNEILLYPIENMHWF